MQIYVARNNEQLGPFDAEAVKSGLHAGLFSPTDPAWHEGAAGWAPLETFPGFAGLAPVATPPPPPQASPPPSPPASQPLPSPQSASSPLPQFVVSSLPRSSSPPMPPTTPGWPQLPPSQGAPNFPGQLGRPQKPRKSILSILGTAALGVLMVGLFLLKVTTRYHRNSSSSSSSSSYAATPRSSTPAPTPANESVLDQQRRLAYQGVARAQGYLGNSYLNGTDGVTQDYRQAFEWLNKSAAQVDTYAQFDLGWMYDNGKGIPMDARLAAELYRKAAVQGHANAQGTLGYDYENGRGIARDLSQALYWYRLSAAQGNAGARQGVERLTNAGVVAASNGTAGGNTSSAISRSNYQNAAGSAGAIQANDLYRASKSDPAATNAQYNGKLLTITGTVVHAGTSPFATFVLLGPSDESYVTCNFPSAAKATVEGLRTGQTVTLRGTYTIVGTSLFLIKDCELLR